MNLDRIAKELRESTQAQDDRLRALLETSSGRHQHLCPRQVLGVRFALAGGAALGLSLPRRDKRLLVIVEIDGCFVDGVEVATGASVGHRTLRVEDYGKVAATFVDVKDDRALRVAPRLQVREQAGDYAPGEPSKYFAMLYAYQVMPDAELLSIQEVRLARPVQELISHPGLQVTCDRCGEEIFNEREIYRNGLCLCRTCAQGAYYLAP